MTGPPQVPAPAVAHQVVKRALSPGQGAHQGAYMGEMGEARVVLSSDFDLNGAT